MAHKRKMGATERGLGILCIVPDSVIITILGDPSNSSHLPVGHPVASMLDQAMLDTEAPHNLTSAHPVTKHLIVNLRDVDATEIPQPAPSRTRTAVRGQAEREEGVVQVGVWICVHRHH